MRRECLSAFVTVNPLLLGLRRLEWGSGLTLALLKRAVGAAASPARRSVERCCRPLPAPTPLILDKVALLCPELRVSQLLPDPAGLGGAGGDSDLLEKHQEPPPHPAPHGLRPN